MSLLTHVHVYDERGETHVFGPDDEVPEWAARKMGAHVFADDKHPFPDDADGDGETDRVYGSEPARSGKGSGRDAWAAFAAEKDHPVDADAGRDQIIAELVDADLIPE